MKAARSPGVTKTPLSSMTACTCRPASRLDHSIPGPRDLVLVVVGQAGYIACGNRGVADDDGCVAGGAYTCDGIENGAKLRGRVLGRERVRGGTHSPPRGSVADSALDQRAQ